MRSDPRQDEESGVVHDEVQVFFALLVSPANKMVSWGVLPSSRTETEVVYGGGWVATDRFASTWQRFAADGLFTVRSQWKQSGARGEAMDLVSQRGKTAISVCDLAAATRPSLSFMIGGGASKIVMPVSQCWTDVRGMPNSSVAFRWLFLGRI